MGNIKERLAALRGKMEERGIDVYVVPTADFHQSEYVGEHFKARMFITGFTGSAGTAVITGDEARLWVDGRYFIQAAKEIEGTGIELMKMGEPEVPMMNDYIEAKLAGGKVLGFDGRVVSVGEGQEYDSIAARNGGRIIYNVDLIEENWVNINLMSTEKALVLALEYDG